MTKNKSKFRSPFARLDYEPDVAIGSSERPATGEPLDNIMSRRLGRRSFLKKAAAAAPLFQVLPNMLSPEKAKAANGDGLTFQPIQGSSIDDVIVPSGYDASVLIRWGDSLFSNVPDLNTVGLADQMTSELFQAGAANRQANQFGYNCDFNGYFPLPGFRTGNSNRGILGVNHEFTTNELMYAGFPSFGESFTPEGQMKTRELVTMNPEIVAVDKAAHGVSFVEIRRTRVSGSRRGPGPRGPRVARQWLYIKDSFFNRRITGDTPMEITGPAAGHTLLQTDADPTGRRVYGTLNNCAGGVTPWGTYLACEENFDQYFGNFDAFADRATTPEELKVVEFHGRIPMPGGQSQRGWELVDERFDIDKHPKEGFRFGWVVEMDPYNPQSMPKKRTAMGRFKHEGATIQMAPSGQVAVYSGDDARFEYMFKFVSSGRANLFNREANDGLLDEGTLYAAKFNDDGTGEWLALDISNPALASEFDSQAEVLIDARRAADLLGATPMDRPEDVQPSPTTGVVYLTLTNNTRRRGGVVTAQGRDVSAEADIPNPRAGDDVDGSGSDFDGNPTGHVIEVTETNNDATSETFTWEIFLLCGNPMDPTPNARFITDPADLTDLPLHPRDTYFAGFPNAGAISPIGSPDNVAFDTSGNLWIATDGQSRDLELPEPINDGLYVVPTEGENRGWVRQFFSGVSGCEVVGPEFAPDNRTVFLGIQHPGEGSTLADVALGEAVSDWPDRGGLPPRPSLVTVVKFNNGLIGT